MKLTELKLPSSWVAWIHASYTVAISGAIGALLDFYHAGFDVNHVDYHKLAQTAVVGAVLGLFNYWRKPV